jgi:hypothetical protein
VTLRKGLNDHELGKIIDFAIEQPCVRGVTFQPIQDAGRADGYDAATDRLTLTEVRRKILEQTTVFRPEDVIPVPCHPDSLAMAYALKLAGKVALTGMIEPDVLIKRRPEHDPLRTGRGRSRRCVQAVRHQSLAAVRGDDAARPAVLPAERARASQPRIREHLPRDHHAVHRSSRVRRALGEEVLRHIAHPDGRIIPFDTYNLFYRDDLETKVLQPLRGLRAQESGIRAGLVIRPEA